MQRRRKPGRRHGGDPRKTLQLCAQVRRALELTLIGDCEDEILQNLMVEAVEPAPDDSRMRVVLSAHGPSAALTAPEVYERLELARPLLAHEVIRAINRRKPPELAFDLVGPPPAPDPDDA